MRFGITVMAVLVAGFVWFLGFQDASAAVLGQRSVDLLDSRPTRSILIVGNSRTFFNDMPSMLREIADSAGSPTKFQIETSAVPAARFEDHWVAIDRSKRLLAAGWDDVILQGESAAQSTDEMNASFLNYGAKLAGIAKVHQGRPHLIVNYAYDPETYEGDTEGTGREAHLERIKWNHMKLASENGLDTIKLASVWESVRSSHPTIRLTMDGNHPTAAGSYLYALAVYAFISQGPVAQVSYVPDGVTESDSKALREAVDGFPLLA
jgi:hypothetical protein